jgi:hypothetical protein
MTSYHSAFLRLAAIGVAAAVMTSCNQAKKPAPAETQANVVKAEYPDWPGGAPPAVVAGTVDPRAVDAIKNMSRYLQTLHSFKLETDGSLDAVTADGQRVTVDGQTTYKVKRPGFMIHYVSDTKNRDFYYDGKQITVYSPARRYYASVPAPATNPQALDLMYDKYGIKVPLEDLFRWNDPENKRDENFKGAAVLGHSMQNGVETTHYAFREPEVDWEVWIQDGDKPLPVKVSIVDRTDPARPAFTTRLKWTPNAPVSNADVTFTPSADDTKIQLAQYQGQ